MPGTLAQAVRAKHPGAYDDMTDPQLEAAVKAKYPGAYDDFPTTPTGTTTIGAAPASKPKGTTFGDQAREVGWHEDRGMAGSEFHAPQSSGNERDRPDNSVLGMPPELAAVSALGIGRAAAGGGPSIGAKAVAGAKAAASAASPVVTYEVARTALQSIGLPSGVAMGLAALISARGVGKRAPARAPRQPRAPKAEPVAATPVASPAPPVASAPAVAAPPAPSTSPGAAPASPPAPTPPSLPVKVLKGETLDLPGAGRTPGQMSPASIRNDVALVARRAKVLLEKAEYDEAGALVKNGKSPIEAVAEIANRKGALPVPPKGMPEAPATAARLKLSADEGKVYVLLLRKGKTHQQAVEAIQAQRKLGQMPGVTTPSAAERSVAKRNASPEKRWEEGRPGTK